MELQPIRGVFARKIPSNQDDEKQKKKEGENLQDKTPDVVRKENVNVHPNIQYQMNDTFVCGDYEDKENIRVDAKDVFHDTCEYVPADNPSDNLTYVCDMLQQISLNDTFSECSPLDKTIIVDNDTLKEFEIDLTNVQDNNEEDKGTYIEAFVINEKSFVKDTKKLEDSLEFACEDILNEEKENLDNTRIIKDIRTTIEPHITKGKVEDTEKSIVEVGAEKFNDKMVYVHQNISNEKNQNLNDTVTVESVQAMIKPHVMRESVEDTKKSIVEDTIEKLNDSMEFTCEDILNEEKENLDNTVIIKDAHIMVESHITRGKVEDTENSVIEDTEKSIIEDTETSIISDTEKTTIEFDLLAVQDIEKSKNFMDFSLKAGSNEKNENLDTTIASKSQGDIKGNLDLTLEHENSVLSRFDPLYNSNSELEREKNDFGLQNEQVLDFDYGTEEINVAQTNSNLLGSPAAKSSHSTIPNICESYVDVVDETNEEINGPINVDKQNIDNSEYNYAGNTLESKYPNNSDIAISAANILEDISEKVVNSAKEQLPSKSPPSVSKPKQRFALIPLKNMADVNDKLVLLEEENADLKLQLNASQQIRATLELQLRQKEEVIIKCQAESLRKEQAYKQDIKQLKEKLEEKTVENDNSNVKELQETIKSLKSREAKLISELNTRKNDEQNYRKIMDEYEKTIGTKLSEMQKLNEEHETVKRHLANLELAFSDVHQKYERSKKIIDGYKCNEDALRETLVTTEDTVVKSEEKYESLKAHAKAQIEKSNQEMQLMRDQYETELHKLTAIVKRLEIKNSSLSVSLDQKMKECSALAALCDEVTGKV